MVSLKNKIIGVSAAAFVLAGALAVNKGDLQRTECIPYQGHTTNEDGFVEYVFDPLTKKERIKEGKFSKYRLIGDFPALEKKEMIGTKFRAEYNEGLFGDTMESFERCQ